MRVFEKLESITNHLITQLGFDHLSDVSTVLGPQDYKELLEELSIMSNIENLSKVTHYYSDLGVKLEIISDTLSKRKKDSKNKIYVFLFDDHYQIFSNNFINLNKERVNYGNI